MHLLHGMKVLIDLVKPSRNTWWTVCADYYLASVPAVDKLDKLNLTLSVWLRQLQKISYAFL